MTREPSIWTPEIEQTVDQLAHRPALLGQVAGELAVAGRALEELVKDVDVHDTCERLEQELARGEGHERTREAIELLRYLEEKAGQEVG